MRTLVGIAGGSASGKSTFAQMLCSSLPTESRTLIPVDSYYRDHPTLSPAERATINFDHPSAFDSELLIGHIQDLRQGKRISLPTYDFSTHRRTPVTTPKYSAAVIIVEGILALHWKELRDVFDHKIFVHCPSDLRLARRLARDSQQRGRSSESVLEQWKVSVLPMHEQFCEPTKAHADRLVDGTLDFKDTVQLLVSLLSPPPQSGK